HLVSQEYLSRAGWELHCADPPGSLRPWLPGEMLPASVHDIWCRRATGPWRMQLMVNERENGFWVSRRDGSVRRSLKETIVRNQDGIPHLAPEVQLYFKAKNAGEKDESDFALTAQGLTAGARSWLRDVLTKVTAEHPWIELLQAKGG